MREMIIEMNKVSVDRGTAKNILSIENFTLARGELAAVVGPNGAGKSTFLQTVNLLLDYRGTLRLFGQDADAADKTLLRRRSSMVFQDMLLLKDTVYQNVAYPLRFRHVSPDETKQRVRQILTELGCEHLISRCAHSLSGGETQRVCIARALVTNPELLLLDEPFAALDAATRREMTEELLQLAQRKDIAVLLVSHHFSDVLYFAERAVAVFNGRIVQDDKPEILMRRPANEQVARLVGMENILPCSVTKTGEGQIIRLAGTMNFSLLPAISPTVSLCCLPSDAFYLANWEPRKTERDWLTIEGVVERITPDLGSSRLEVKWGKERLLVRLPRGQLLQDIAPQSSLTLTIDAAELHFL